MKHLILIILVASLSILSVQGQNQDSVVAKEVVSDSMDTVGSDSIMVYVSFIVNKKGKVKNVKVVHASCDSCDRSVLESLKKEAVRVVRKMPPFKVKEKSENEEESDKPKKMRLTVPIHFDLE